MEIRLSYDRLISTMGLPILVRCHLYIKSGHCFHLMLFFDTEIATVVVNLTHVRQGSFDLTDSILQLILHCLLDLNMPLMSILSHSECVYETKQSGPLFNINIPSYQYGKSHCGDKTVVRSSYLPNGISFTGKMSCLYWISPLVTTEVKISAPMVLNYFSRFFRPQYQQI